MAANLFAVERKLKHSGLFLAIGLVMASALAQAGTVYFVSDTNNHTLYSMDPTTNVITTIGSLGIDGSNNTFGDLAWDSQNNTMYYSGGRGDESIYSVNLTTGAATLVGADNQTDLFALGFNGGNNTMYGGSSSGGSFGSINLANGAFTNIGSNGLYAEGMTYNSLTGQFIESDGGENIYSVNVTNGNTSLLGNVASDTNDNGIAYDADHNAYWLFNYNGSIQEVNASTYAVMQSFNGNIGLGSSVAYVSQSVPEPSAIAILGLGMLGLIRRRK